MKTLRLQFIALLLSVALATPIGRADSSQDAFYFVQISDTHIGTHWHHERLAKVVDAINGLPMPIACVVHTGDLCADNTDRPEKIAAGLDVLAKLIPPLHVLPGNHDILPARRDATLAAYREKVGALCTSVSYHGVQFLLVYTEPLATGIAIPDYDPLLWLKQELQKAGEKPVLVFHHRPSIADFYKNKLQPGWPDATRRQWISLLSSANVKAVIAGHFHRDELHWLDEIPLFTGAPVAAYWKRQASFRVYRYENGRLSYRTHYIDE